MSYLTFFTILRYFLIISKQSYNKFSILKLITISPQQLSNIACTKIHPFTTERARNYQILIINEIVVSMTIRKNHFSKKSSFQMWKFSKYHLKETSKSYFLKKLHCFSTSEIPSYYYQENYQNCFYRTWNSQWECVV